MPPSLHRWLSLSCLFAAAIALGVACSSSSHDKLSGGATGVDAGDSAVLTFDTYVVFDAVQATDAPYVKCGLETCPRGDICVVDQQLGGAVVSKNDAGVCPDGDVPAVGGSDSGQEASVEAGTGTGADASPVQPQPAGCMVGPTYHCKGLPALCGGALTCSCGQPLCTPGFTCQQTKDLNLTCIEDAP